MARRRLLFMILTLVALVSLSASAALAQETSAEASIVIEGRILRPQASYIIQRANIDFGIAVKKRSFVHKIGASINKAPF